MARINKAAPAKKAARKPASTKKGARKPAAPAKKAVRKPKPARKPVAAPKPKPEPVITAVACTRKPRRACKPKQPVRCTCNKGVLANGQPCANCSPMEVAARNRAEQGRCMHEESGMCPACLQKTIVSTPVPAAKRQVIEMYQVYRDLNGIAYLRVAPSKAGAQFCVNKGFSVELVDLSLSTQHVMNLQPVLGASIYECANRLLHPLNDQVTISQRAKAHLETILNTEEIRNAMTKKTAAATNVATSKPAKFATVTAPAAKQPRKAKAAAAPAEKPARQPKAAKPAKAAAGEEAGQRGRMKQDFGSKNLEGYVLKLGSKQVRPDSVKGHITAAIEGAKKAAAYDVVLAAFVKSSGTDEATFRKHLFPCIYQDIVQAVKGR